jgi:hypothetical protein
MTKSVAYRLDEELLERLDQKSKELGCSKRFLIEKGLKIVLSDPTVTNTISRPTEVGVTENKPKNQNNTLVDKFRQKARIK